MAEHRPPLTATLSGAELLRWYWLTEELRPFARQLGVHSGGGKQELTARIAAALDGRSVPPPATRRPPAAPALAEPLTPATRIPDGQRCTQQLRRYFRHAVGPGFRFDAAIRDFLAAGEGRTLADAVEHWHRTRSAPPRAIGTQFELNRFVRGWHADHPDGLHAEALEAWRTHRAQPVDGRPLG